MAKASKPKKRRWQRFCNFFKETFRARDKNDYKEFFTRGLRGRDSRTKIEPCWMFVRVFALSFVLFSLIAFLIVKSENGIAVPTLYLLGGAFMNLTVAVFIYELNPERNLPFALFLFIMLLGAVSADFITMFGYYFLYPQNVWLAPLWTAVLEELAKAIPTIVVILLFKKRSPMLGFIIGASIGAGFSITEDMGYIYAYSYGVRGMLEIAIARAWTAVCTHTLWTAVIGWAFCKFRRPYDLRFLGVVLSSIALHYIWDMPVESDFSFITVPFCVAAAVIFSVVIVKKERKPYKQTVTGEVQLVFPIPEDRNRALTRYGKWCSYSANFIAALTAVAVGVAFILWCLAPVETVYNDKRFKSDEEFIKFVQGDKVFYQKWDKKFEDCADSVVNSGIIVNGKYTMASVSVEEDDGYEYKYTFSFTENADTGENEGTVISITVTVGQEEYRLYKLKVPVTDGGLEYREVTYAKVAEFYSCYYSSDNSEFVVIIDWYFDDTAKTVVTAFGAGITLLGAVAFTVFKLKSMKIRRKENVG